MLPVVELFCDASSTPPHVAAVLCSPDGLRFAHWRPCNKVMANFCVRRDSQIMGLETVAIVIGLFTFERELKGKCVRVWCDNVGGEQALLKGSARAPDHNLLIHGCWMLAAKSGFELWVERVPSKENIADEPSHEEFGALVALGAKQVEPVVPEQLCKPLAWAESRVLKEIE